MTVLEIVAAAVLLAIAVWIRDLVWGGPTERSAGVWDPNLAKRLRNLALARYAWKTGTQYLNPDAEDKRIASGTTRRESLVQRWLHKFRK
jgi:hypothetical protein